MSVHASHTGFSLPPSDQLQSDHDSTDQLMTNFGIRWSFRRIPGKKALPDKTICDKHFRVKAGDQIGVDDVQLEKSSVGAQTFVRQGLIPLFVGKNEGHRSVTTG